MPVSASPDMIIDVILLITGLALLLGGGDMLVRGASALARSLGISTLIIGLTVVAFGTSSPELAVNLTASLTGRGGISFGNIIGANMANIGLILGFAAMLKPLEIGGKVVLREIPMMILAATAALVMGLDGFMRNSVDSYDRTDGLVLLLFFGVFMYYTISEVVGKRPEDPLAQQAVKLPLIKGLKSSWLNLLMIAFGTAALIGGGKLVVESASEIAQTLRLPRTFIGLTVIAWGTTLPELATSVMAARKGQTDLAVGNIVGSNIFNLLFIIGISSSIRPVPISPAGRIDLVVMAFLSLLLLPLAISHRFRIVRPEGGLLIIIYFSYILWRTVSASS